MVSRIKKRKAKKSPPPEGGITIEYGVLVSGLSIALLLAAGGVRHDIGSFFNQARHDITHFTG
jgi:hypothetical protein